MFIDWLSLHSGLIFVNFVDLDLSWFQIFMLEVRELVNIGATSQKWFNTCFLLFVSLCLLGRKLTFKGTWFSIFHWNSGLAQRNCTFWIDYLGSDPQWYRFQLCHWRSILILLLNIISILILQLYVLVSLHIILILILILIKENITRFRSLGQYILIVIFEHSSCSGMSQRWFVVLIVRIKCRIIFRWRFQVRSLIRWGIEVIIIKDFVKLNKF